MCGDLDEEDRFEADLVQRFQVHSLALLERHPAGGDALNAYLDRLFADTLRRCAGDVDTQEGGLAYARLAMQSLVLARLAGFLAGHVALQEDPLRKLIEAVMLGYAEAETPAARDHHGHADEPGHAHAHGHEHSHDHAAPR
ncbi:MAG: hypothetical protein WA210_17755 [Burkholderiaceae bacterium]